MQRKAAIAAVLVAVLAAALWLWRQRAPADPVEPVQGAGARPSAGEGPGPALHEAYPQAAPPPAATEADGAVEVTVLAGGARVPGAQVRLYLRGATDPNTQLVDWRLAGAGAAGANGVLRLPARPGRYLVSVRAPPWAAARRELVRPLGEQVTRVAVALAAGAALSGHTVARASREPVPNAAVALTFTASEGDRRPSVPDEEQVRGLSDARGAFRIDGVEPGRYRVEARAEGFGRAVARQIEVPRGELLLELGGSSFIEGHVVDGKGQPAPGAEVLAAGAQEPFAGASTRDGAFSLEVEPRTYRLSARRGSEAGALDAPVAVAAGQTRRVEIRLGPACALAGVVVAASSGKPVAGASVAVSPHDANGDSGRAVSDVKGAFAVEGLAPGAYDVVVSAQHFNEVEKRGLAVLPGQRFSARLELTGTGAIEGRVRDGSGQPVAGALVSGGQRFLGPSFASAPAEVRTGQDGSFRIEEVAAGMLSVSAHRDGSALGVAQTVSVPEGGTGRVDLTLPGDGDLVGHVTHGSAAPASAVSVRVFSAGRGPGGFAGADVASTGAAPDGSYHFTLPEGSYRVFASAEGGGQSPWSGSIVAVEAGRTTTRDLTLGDAGSEDGFSGTVLEPDGAPSPGATVTLSAAGAGRRPVAAVAADESGHFTVPRARSDLPDLLEVRARNGSRSGTATAPQGATSATVMLQAGASLRGRVVGDPPVAGFTLVIQGHGEQRLDFGGDLFSVGDVPGEPFSISVQTGDGRTGAAQVQAAPGGSAEVEVRVQGAAAISGRAVDSATRQPLSGVLVGEGSSMGGGEVESGADGRFRLTGLGAGELALHFVGAGGLTHSQSVQIAAGQQLDLGDVALDRPRAQPGQVGLSLRGDSSEVSVGSVIAGSPADLAGVRLGDVLLLIDGVAPSGVTDASQRIRGDAGTFVAFTLRRNGESRSVSVQRAQ